MEEQQLLYHESQQAALCGVHCLNTLLQGPYFSEVDLGQISQELDAEERKMMAEGGMDGDEYKKFIAEGSHNAAADGMFSVQVLDMALKVWGLSCISIDSPEAGTAAQRPEDEQAFILNLQEHWFTIRQACGGWWNFNSLFPAPEALSPFYLAAFLATMREQGYQIFVVRGELPAPSASPSSEEAGKWFTPQQAREASSGAVAARQSGYAKALATGLREKSSTQGTFVTLRPRLGGDEDADLARAIAASMAEATGAHPSADDDWAASSSGAAADGVDPALLEADPELAAAIAASLASSGGAPPAQPVFVDPGPEPAPGPGVIDIALRLPDGERIMRRFRTSDPILSIVNYAASKGVDMNMHILSRMYPRQVLDDRRMSVGAAGLSNMETLLVGRLP